MRSSGSAGCGSWSTRRTSRPSPSTRPGGGSASASGCCSRSLDVAIAAAGARDDPGGPALEPAGSPAVREVRLPARRHPAALLQRRRRGRADHDHATRCRMPSMRERIERLRFAIDAAPGAGRRRPSRGRPRDRTGSSCRSSRPATRPGSRSSRTAGGSVSNVVASQVALHAADGRHRARGRGPGPPALDRAGARRGLGRRRRRLVGRRRRSRSPTARAWRARCWSGSTSRRRWPGSTTCRSSASTTSRVTSTRPGCSIPARPIARSRPSRSSRSSSRAATRSSSRCATT